MRDTDLAVTCKCGCVEIVRKDGYDSSNLDDAAQMGNVASALCHKRPKGEWLNVKKWAFYASVIVVILSLNAILGHRNIADESLALLRRSHMRYMILDLDGARSDALRAVKLDPLSEDARSCLVATDCAVRSLGYACTSP